MNVHIHAVPRHISAPRRIVARHEHVLGRVDTIIIIIVSTRLIGENTSMFNCCWRSEM